MIVYCLKVFSSIEENNDKPGIHGNTFKSILDKEDLTPYYDVKLIEELYDYSRNFVKAKIEELFKLKVRYNEALLENQKEKDNHARAMKLFSYKDYKAEVDYKEKQEQGNNLEANKLFNKTIEEANLRYPNYYIPKTSEGRKDFEKNLKLCEKFYKDAEDEMWLNSRDRVVVQHDINYPFTPKESFKKESKFKTWINKLFKK